MMNFDGWTMVGADGDEIDLDVLMAEKGCDAFVFQEEKVLSASFRVPGPIVRCSSIPPQTTRE
jgi:hypothetical protein